MQTTICLDRLLNVVHADGAAQEFFGCTLSTIIGNNIHLLFSLKKAEFPLKTLLAPTTWPVLFSVKFEIENVFCSVDCKVDVAPASKHNEYYFILNLESENNTAPPSLPQHILSSIGNISFDTQSPTFLPLIGQIINSMPGKAHFKEASTLTYQYSNKETLKLLGMTDIHELINFNDYEVAKHMEWRWPGKFAENLQELDNKVIQSHQPIVDFEETPYFDANGNIVLHFLTKIPLYSSGNEPLGILTFAIDQSKSKDIHWLRNMYVKLYPNKKLGFQYFLENIGISKILQKRNSATNADHTLSERQFDTLVLIAQGKTVKECAKVLCISNRTVEQYVNQLREKFVCLSKSELSDLYHQVICDKFKN